MSVVIELIYKMKEIGLQLLSSTRGKITRKNHVHLMKNKKSQKKRIKINKKKLVRNDTVKKQVNHARKFNRSDLPLDHDI